MIEFVSEKLEARVARLRAKLYSTSRGRRLMEELASLGIVCAEANSLDFADWNQWVQWPDYWSQKA